MEFFKLTEVELKKSKALWIGERIELL